MQSLNERRAQWIVRHLAAVERKLDAVLDQMGVLLTGEVIDLATNAEILEMLADEADDLATVASNIESLKQALDQAQQAGREVPQEIVDAITQTANAAQGLVDASASAPSEAPPEAPAGTGTTDAPSGEG